MKNKQRMEDKKDKESIASEPRDGESQQDSKISHSFNKKNNGPRI